MAKKSRSTIELITLVNCSGTSAVSCGASIDPILALAPDQSGLNLQFSPNLATPLPAALPLFGSALGVMGFFGLRRKRKATAEAAA